MKIAFVVQRYGEEVNGGSELHCRMMAEKMTNHFEIEVITTCALDYVTWQNHYEPGASVINDVNVKRFPVDFPRNNEKFNAFSQHILNGKSSESEQLQWMDLQGPHSSKLLDYLKEAQETYDLIVFYTYLYWPTFHGSKIVPEKNILVPTAHDEPPIYLDIFKESFLNPQGLIFLTNAEKNFVNSHFNNKHIQNIVLGIGIEKLEVTEQQLQDFKNKYGLTNKYVLYAGRIEPAKGCDTLLEYFERFSTDNPDIDLVLIGKEVMSVPKHEHIKSLGFLSDEEKNTAIKGAQVLLMPSQYESLSIAALEAWQLQTPLLVNAKSEVLKEHCLESKGGLYYDGPEEFAASLSKLLNDSSLRRSLRINGKKYVQENFRWSKIEKRFTDFMHKISNTVKQVR